MPPAFFFWMGLVAWVGLAIVVCAIAGVFTLRSRSRRTGLRLALAMAFTFPAIIAYQLLAAPVIAALLLGMYLFWNTLEPGHATETANPAVILVTIAVASAAFAVAMGMSIVGFWEGWRLGWLSVPGGRLWNVVQDGPLFRSMRYLRRRVSRSRAA